MFRILSSVLLFCIILFSFFQCKSEKSSQKNDMTFKILDLKKIEHVQRWKYPINRGPYNFFITDTLCLYASDTDNCILKFVRSEDIDTIDIKDNTTIKKIWGIAFKDRESLWFIFENFNNLNQLGILNLNTKMVKNIIPTITNPEEIIWVNNEELWFITNNRDLYKSNLHKNYLIDKGVYKIFFNNNYISYFKFDDKLEKEIAFYREISDTDWKMMPVDKGETFYGMINSDEMVFSKDYDPCCSPSTIYIKNIKTNSSMELLQSFNGSMFINKNYIAILNYENVNERFIDVFKIK